MVADLSQFFPVEPEDRPARCVRMGHQLRDILRDADIQPRLEAPKTPPGRTKGAGHPREPSPRSSNGGN